MHVASAGAIPIISCLNTHADMSWIGHRRGGMPASMTDDLAVRMSNHSEAQGRG